MTDKPSEPYEVWGMPVPPSRQDSQFHPESMLRMYPYGASIGYDEDLMVFGCQPVVLFYGDEYIVVAGVVEATPGGLPVGCDVAFGYTYTVAFGFNLGRSIGHFAHNVVRTAGRAVGTVTKPLQNTVGMIGRQLNKVPIVGSPLRAVMDFSYHATVGPVNMAVEIAQGRRIDRAVMGHLKDRLNDFKQVGPYVQTVVSFVPGVGQGVSAALGAGLALADGQPIDEVLKAGALGAVPGGPLVQAAVRTGVETIQHVAKGDKMNFATIANTAAGAAATGLGLPDTAKNAIIAGVSTAGNIAQGKPLDKALTDGAVHALPIPDSAKRAMTEASTLTLDLAHGKRVDQALLSRANGVMGMLPVNSPLRNNLKIGVDAVKNVAQGKNAEHVLMTSLQTGIADELLSHGSANLPPAVRGGIKSGIALGTGAMHQALMHHQITKVIPGKIAESGLQLSKTSPLFGEARKIAASKGGSRGFDLASGLLNHEAGLFHIATVRNMLTTPHDKMGFDLAAAARVGAVTHPKPPTLSPAAHAGHAITMGMQSYVPDRKVAMMESIQKHPGAGAGAASAIKQVAINREGFIPRLVRIIKHTFSI